MLTTLLWTIYYLLFLISVGVILKFEWGNEGKDERGKSIRHFALSIVFPLIIIGWLLITLFDSIRHLSYPEYKWAIWYLITGSCIIQAALIFYIKRKY